MSFQFQCPHCSAKLEAEDDWIGLETTCPKLQSDDYYCFEHDTGKTKNSINSCYFSGFAGGSTSKINTISSREGFIRLQQISLYLPLLWNFNLP